MTIAKAVRLTATGSFFAIAIASSASAQAANGQDPANSGEIIVTAQKRAENVLNVPISISVVDAKKLEDLHATSLSDYFAYVPGLQAVSQGTAGQEQLSIRGISPQGAGAATVATYIDDTPVGSSSAYSRSASYALDLLPYDVQRIEVLRGPQGTLYGSSAESGLLKYVLTSPSLDKFSARVGGDLFGISGAGQAGGGGRAQVSTPIIDGKLGVLASYAYESTPGYINDERTGETDINSVRQQSGRLALLWKPSDDFTVRLGALYQKIDADGSGTVALSSATLQPVYGSRSDDRYIDQPFNKTIQYYSAALNWNLGFAALTSATSYSDTDLKQRFDNTPSFGTFPHLFDPTQPALAITPFDIRLRLHKVTEEVRLASPTGSRLEWLVGGFYTHESSANYQTVPAFNMTTGQPLTPPYNLLATLQLPSTYQEYAFFGNTTFHLNDIFALSGGIRYSHNNQTFSQINSGLLVGTSDTPGKSSEGVITYSVSPEIHVSKKVMVYARVATGYRPGGPNFSLPNVPSTFKADRLTNYEVGIKTQLWDNRITFNAAYFYINWKDVQVSVVNPVGISYFANAGRTTSEGVEADATIKVAAGLTVAGTFAYTDAKLKDDAPSIGGVAGEQLAYVPHYSGSLQADYTAEVGAGWKAHGGGALRLQGRRFSGVGTQAFVIPGYAALDLNADISRGRYTFKLFAKNVTNRVAYDFYGPRFSGGALTELGSTLIQPRTVGVAVDLKF
jgi:iron complex outermembrane recepter protein